MKYRYVIPKRKHKATRKLLDQIVNIVNDYQRQGYRMTLRQLYYQLVSRDIISNEQKEYSKLGYILSDARLEGEIDWDFIEDRVR